MKEIKTAVIIASLLLTLLMEYHLLKFRIHSSPSHKIRTPTHLNQAAQNRATQILTTLCATAFTLEVEMRAKPLPISKLSMTSF